MTTKLTLFTAILVQDSALSVSGLDRETTTDQPFTFVRGVPTLVGRGLKGAAVSMARRFFDPLPRAVSENITHGALRRSAWEFADATPVEPVTPAIRAGVGIRHRTGARAGGVLYDREIIPARTKWPLSFRVNRSYVRDDAEFAEVEGILGYVLSEHWAKDRCWLGGGVARGLGWCHIEALRAYRLDEAAYEAWVLSRRAKLPQELPSVPFVSPTRSWCFRTLDVNISFGEYKPDSDETAWGLDMFAVGPHDSERAVQATGDGQWAKPAWAKDASTPDVLNTNRALLMEGPKGAERPVLPGASVRGPLRHAFSRQENRRAGRLVVEDPNRKGSMVQEGDVAGAAFGTVSKSSRILIRDARAEPGWAAAKLHMHAEDEFSAGSFGSSKRDAVRVLRATFPVRIVVEGPTAGEVEPLVTLVNRQVALGALGHLFVGGHKTRGAGAARWTPKRWANDDVVKTRDWSEPHELQAEGRKGERPKRFSLKSPEHPGAWVKATTGMLAAPLSLGAAAKRAKVALGEQLVAWWCDPTIDLNLHTPPAVFGRAWPPDSDDLQVDEVAFFAERAVWRAARTADGTRSVLIQEVDSTADDAKYASVHHTRARLHGFADGSRPRFSSAKTSQGDVLLREWHVDGEVLGFTITQEQL